MAVLYRRLLVLVFISALLTFAGCGGRPGKISTESNSGSSSASNARTGNARTVPAQSGGSQDDVAGVSVGGGGLLPLHYVLLQWNASTSPIMGYNVYRSSTSGGPYQKINSTLEPATSYLDNSVAAGQRYYYVVTSVNASAESSYSSQIEAAVP